LVKEILRKKTQDKVDAEKEHLRMKPSKTKLAWY